MGIGDGGRHQYGAGCGPGRRRAAVRPRSRRYTAIVSALKLEPKEAQPGAAATLPAFGTRRKADRAGPERHSRPARARRWSRRRSRCSGRPGSRPGRPGCRQMTGWPLLPAGTRPHGLPREACSSMTSWWPPTTLWTARVFPPELRAQGQEVKSAWGSWRWIQRWLDVGAGTPEAPYELAVVVHRRRLQVGAIPTGQRAAVAITSPEGLSTTLALQKCGLLCHAPWNRHPPGSSPGEGRQRQGKRCPAREQDGTERDDDGHAGTTQAVTRLDSPRRTAPRSS